MTRGLALCLYRLHLHQSQVRIQLWLRVQTHQTLGAIDWLLPRQEHTLRVFSIIKCIMHILVAITNITHLIIGIQLIFVRRQLCSYSDNNISNTNSGCNSNNIINNNNNSNSSNSSSNNNRFRACKTTTVYSLNNLVVQSAWKESVIYRQRHLLLCFNNNNNSKEEMLLQIATL